MKKLFTLVAIALLGGAVSVNPNRSLGFPSVVWQ